MAAAAAVGGCRRRGGMRNRFGIRRLVRLVSARSSADLATLDSPRLSLVEKLERSQACTDSAVLQQRTAIFREELELLAKELDAASGEQSVAEVAAKAAHLSALKPGGMQGRVDALVHDCREKEEDLLLKKIAAAFDSHAADFRELCDRFLREHPSSPQSDKVREMTSRLHGDDEKAERERIKQIRVSTAANLAAKGEEIGKFVSEIPGRPCSIGDRTHGLRG